MGLDINVYQHVATLPPHTRGDTCWDQDNHKMTCCYVGFEQSFRNFPIVETDPKTKLHYGPCVRVWGESFNFRAGSYSGYNYFREALAIAALDVEPHRIWDEPDKFCDQPFFELINFGDNEGTIGPEACADLAEDFRTHAKLQDLLPYWYPDAFGKWAKAFDLAAGHGMVEFR